MRAGTATTVNGPGSLRTQRASRPASVSRLRRRAPAIQGSADRSTGHPAGPVGHEERGATRRRMRVAPRKARPFVPGTEGRLVFREIPERLEGSAMSVTNPPSLAEVRRLASSADTILLRAGRDADLETPIGAFLRMDDGGPSYLLESVEGGERLGRYSFFGVGPRRILTVSGGTSRVQARPVEESRWDASLPTTTLDVADPLEALGRSSRAGASSRSPGCRGSSAAPSAPSRTTPSPRSSRPSRSPTPTPSACRRRRSSRRTSSSSSTT